MPCSLPTLQMPQLIKSFLITSWLVIIPAITPCLVNVPTSTLCLSHWIL
jgi:hypothetical protein